MTCFITPGLPAPRYQRTGAPVAVQWCVVIAIAPLLILAAVVDVVEMLWDCASDQPREKHL